MDSPIAVLDTNVFLNIMTCVDAARQYTQDLAIRADKAIFVRKRARQAIALSEHLNGLGAITYSLNEATRIALREVSGKPKNTLDHAFTHIWLDYVKPSVLPNWRIAGPPEHEGEPFGNGADRLLVQRAKEFGIPLISFEGVSPTGAGKEKLIPRFAREQGVALMTPEQFYAPFDEHRLAAMFYLRLDTGSERFINEHEQDRSVVAENMATVKGYYWHVLFDDKLDFREPQ